MSTGREANGLAAAAAPAQVFSTSPPVASLSTVNWVTAGYVTPVKDQGQCGELSIDLLHIFMTQYSLISTHTLSAYHYLTYPCDPCFM